MPQSKSDQLAAYEHLVDNLRKNAWTATEAENFEGTAERVLRMHAEMSASPDDIRAELNKQFTKVFPTEGEGEHGMVIQGPIILNSCCPHHLMPVRYKAFIAYIPKTGRITQVFGLSKPARIMQAVARRLVLQETLCDDLATLLYDPASLPLFKDHPAEFEVQTEGAICSLIGIHTCFSPDTEILTENGWARFDLLEKGVKVVQVDRQTMRSNLVKPTDYIKTKSKRIVHMKSPGVDLLVTPEHKMLYQTAHKYNRGHGWAKTEVQNLPVEFYMPQISDWQGKQVKAQKFDGHTLTADQFVSLLGLYFSEGCWRGEGSYQDNVFKRRGIEIVQKTGTAEYDKIKSFLESLPFTVEERQWSGVSYFFLYSEDLPEYLIQFGRLCINMRAPAIIRNATQAQIRLFLDWYYLGDGDKWHDKVESNRVPGSEIITTASKQMVADLQELYWKIGKVMHIHSYEGVSYQNGSGNKYRVWGQHSRTGARTRNAAFFNKTRHTFQEMPYSGHVYCVTVPKGNIVVRRNGKILIVGNCMSCRGVHSDAKTMQTSRRGAFVLDSTLESRFMQSVALLNSVQPFG